MAAPPVSLDDSVAQAGAAASGVPEPGADPVAGADPEVGPDVAAAQRPGDETEIIHVTPPVFEELNFEGYGEQRPKHRHVMARQDTPRRDVARHEKRRQERKMADRLSCSAAGITEVILDELAEDAKVRSSADLEEILVTVKREGPDSPELVVDGDKVYVRDGFVSRIEVPPGVAVTAGEALGDLKIPRFEGDLRLRNVMGDLRIENVTGRVDVEHVFGDVRAEDVAELHVMDCDADFRFSGGDLEIESVSGDMRVTDAGNVEVLRVHGDLWIERLSGGVKVETTHGDARLNDIEGAAGVGMVAGDFRATNVRGALNAGQVHGDAQLEGPFPAEDGYAVSTSGDAHIRLMAEDEVRLVVRALGRVRSNLPLIPERGRQHDIYRHPRRWQGAGRPDGERRLAHRGGRRWAAKKCADRGSGAEEDLAATLSRN